LETKLFTMETYRRKIIFFSIFFIGILLLFNSCSIGGAYFFVNDSDKTITFIQHFKDFNKTEYYYKSKSNKTVLEKIKDPETTIYGMTNSDRKFNRRTHKHLEPVPIQIDSINQIVEIIIPPKKAIRFDNHHNLRYYFSKKIQLKIDNQVHELDDLKLKYKNRGFGIHTCVIKYQG